MKRWILPKTDVEPDSPEFPTSDFAHNMAAAVAEAKKRKKKKAKSKKLDGVDLEV
jgi:hypothetical protein